MNTLRRFSCALLAALILAGCAPLTNAPAAPLDQVATRAIEVRATATPLPTLSPPAPSPTPLPTADSGAPTPAITLQPTAMPVFGEPAGCRMPSETETYTERLAYAAQLFPTATSLS